MPSDPNPCPTGASAAARRRSLAIAAGVLALAAGALFAVHAVQAGTIHALGPGLTVLEIQQAVDLTYRLYDYGRPRELHLEESADVVNARPHHNDLDTHVNGGSKLLVDGPHFGVAWCVGEPPQLASRMREVQLLPIDGPVGIVKPGECALIDAGAARTLMCDGRFVLAWSTE